VIITSMEQELLTGRIIGRAMKVHRTLGPGYLESVYLNALALELRRAGHTVECEKEILVRYEGVVVGTFRADMLVDGCILVETKAVRALAPAHEAQVISYLTATGIDIGLLLNFGAPRLEFRRKSRVHRPALSRGEQGQQL
jgi:GxxExxY protein